MAPVQEAIAAVQAGPNPALALAGYLLTMVDKRLTVHATYEALLRELYRHTVFTASRSPGERLRRGRRGAATGRLLQAEGGRDQGDPRGCRRAAGPVRRDLGQEGGMSSTKGVDKLKASLGGQHRGIDGGREPGEWSRGSAAGPSHGVTARYDGVTRPKDALTIPVAKLSPDPDQPRREFDEDELQRLAESLRTKGQLQPIRVRWVEAEKAWVIVSGERRWRAAKLAGLATLACVEVKGEPTADEILEDQLIENALRTDLKPGEQATAYKTLMDRRGLSAHQLAERLSLSTMTVTRRPGACSSSRPPSRRRWSRGAWRRRPPTRSARSRIPSSRSRWPRRPSRRR